jgi:hypothetical protein
MPRTKGLYTDLPKLLQRQTVDTLMLGYVIGWSKRSTFPVLQIKNGVESFMREMNITEDEYPLESAIVTYYRMLKEYNSFKKYHETNKI